MVEFPDRHMIGTIVRSYPYGPVEHDYFSTGDRHPRWFARPALGLAGGKVRSIFLTDFPGVGSPRWVVLASFILMSAAAVVSLSKNPRLSRGRLPAAALFAISPILVFQACALFQRWSPFLHCR